jgi:hypothetical protein
MELLDGSDASRRTQWGAGEPRIARSAAQQRGWRQIPESGTAHPRPVVEALVFLDNAADDHLQAARHAVIHNQWMQQPIPSASKLSSGLASDPQR